MQSGRMARVSELMISEISAILLRRVKDPRVKHVTISGVKVAKDLRQATVYFTILIDEVDRKDVLTGLNRAAGFIRRELFDRLSLKTIPHLTFKFDPSIEYSAHIDEILHSLKEETPEDETEES
jgi:ribosome-binding factor A